MIRGRERPSVLHSASIGLVMLLAAALRLFELGKRSLWTDEGSTWTAASLPFGDMLRRCVERDASPPLFYLFTSWCLKFGNDEAHLRLVSVFASLALVWLTYRIARIGLERRQATFAALLCALSPYQVMYAQEARTYTLVAAILVTSIYLYARGLTAQRPKPWIALAFTTGLGLWTQSIAALGVTSQGALALFSREGRRRFAPWIAALVGGVVLYLPWAWYSRGVSEHLSSSHWYIPDPDALGVFKVLRAALLSPLPLVSAPEGSTLPGLDRYLPRLAAWAAVALAPVAALLLSLPELLGGGSRSRLARVAWATWFVPVVAVYAVSLVGRPLFMTRYFVFVTPGVCVLFALGVTALRPLAARALLGVWLVALALLGLQRYQHDYTKEPWREVTQDIGARADAAHTAVLVPFDVDPFAFYDAKLAHPVSAFEVSHPDEPFAAHFTPEQLDELEAAARLSAAPFDEVWVIVRSPNSDVRKEVARRAEAAAGEGRTLVERRRWDSLTGPLRVSRFLRGVPDSLRRDSVIVVAPR